MATWSHRGALGILYPKPCVRPFSSSLWAPIECWPPSYQLTKPGSQQHKSLSGRLSNQGEKSVNFCFIRVPLSKKVLKYGTPKPSLLVIGFRARGLGFGDFGCRVQG